MQQNDPATVGCVYQGHVMHMRLTPFRHRFRYRVFALLIDIDRLEGTIGPLRTMALDRPGLLSFHRRDHGPRDGSELRPWVEAQLAARGRPVPRRIMLLSFPRVFGYVFNPLSVYFCEDGEGRLQSVVYEVKNTFGDQHPYVLAAEPDADGAVRHGTGKAFFVSPFIGMEQDYRFTLHPPSDRLAVKIRQQDMIATQTGRRRPLTDAELVRQFVLHPLMTAKVVGAIHWQAVRLWLKGAPFRRYRGGYPDRAEALNTRPPPATRAGNALSIKVNSAGGETGRG